MMPGWKVGICKKLLKEVEVEERGKMLRSSKKSITKCPCGVSNEMYRLVLSETDISFDITQPKDLKKIMVVRAQGV